MKESNWVVVNFDSSIRSKYIETENEEITPVREAELIVRYATGIAFNENVLSDFY